MMMMAIMVTMATMMRTIMADDNDGDDNLLQVSTSHQASFHDNQYTNDDGHFTCIYGDDKRMHASI
jgi:hypothetical protein